MTGETSTIRRFSDPPFVREFSARLQAVLSSRLTNHQAAHICEDRNLRNEDMPALGRRDAAKIVDDHLPLIRKLVWEFIKRHGDGVGYYELEAVAYEAARQAGETFNPNLGFAYATHCRKRIRFALIDYVGDRNRVVKDLEFRPKQYTTAWGDPDAEKKPWKGGRPYSLTNGSRTGSASGATLLDRINPTNPFCEATARSPAGTARLASPLSRRNSPMAGSRPATARHGSGPGSRTTATLASPIPAMSFGPGDKEAQGQREGRSADCSDWKRIWAANYREHRCGSEYQVRPWERAVEVTPAALEAADQPKSYERADGATMIEVAPHCYVSHAYLEGKAALIETARRQFAPTHYRPGLDDWLADYWAKKSGAARTINQPHIRTVVTTRWCPIVQSLVMRRCGWMTVGS